MIKRLCMCAFVSAIGTVLAAPIYKTEDEFGNPVFSDKAAAEAEEVEVQEPVTFDSSKYTRQYEKASRYMQDDKEGEASKNYKYQMLAITSPENGAAIRNNAGILELQFKIEPGIQPGHSIALMMDGKKHSKVSGSGSVSMQNIDRGTHQFYLNVTGTKDKKILQAGPSISITLQRYSVKH
ncbi:MAG: hypothetical protein CMQ19_11360 [Gammaproteobacteria bacterium]|nr:hypothetical protein [Gammaproteobacteria bacterium]|tara:strand:+ start:1240 stop:1782 length:543 start_codon:yes stop_codon:yes gene_type:complete